MGEDSIPLARAMGFGALPDLIEERAGERALHAVFEAVGVPIALRNAPKTPMPLFAMMGLFARGARALDDRTFGLEVGRRMTHRAYGLWIEHCVGAPTLGEALHRAVTTNWAQQNGARLEFVADDERRIFRYASPRLDVDKTHHSDHLIPAMLTFFRLYLGPDWRPDWIEVDYARDCRAAQIEGRLQIPVLFGRPGVGVGLGRRNLMQKRPSLGSGRQPRVVTLRDGVADVVLTDAPEPARSLSAVVTLRLLDGQADIDGAARMAGVSVQSLQRSLRQKGYTYREILDLARRDRATGLLMESDASVLEIALSLGYEDHANFTRAFIRWTGCTPTDFRRAGRRAM